MGYKKVIATLEKEIKSGKYEAFLLIDKVKDILLFYLIYFNNIFGYCFNKFQSNEENVLNANEVIAPRIMFIESSDQISIVFNNINVLEVHGDLIYASVCVF